MFKSFSHIIVMSDNNDDKYGEYTHCGCGMSSCKLYFMRYIDMSYNRLLLLATNRGLISHREKPEFTRVVNMLIQYQYSVSTV